MPQQQDNVTTAQRLEQPQCNKNAHSAVQVANLFRKSKRKVVQKLKPPFRKWIRKVIPKWMLKSSKKFGKMITNRFKIYLDR